MENPFETLANGLAEIHADIIADAGNGEQIRLMGKAEGFFPTAARKILEVLGDILSWGYTHLTTLRDLLEQVDAAVACFEVALGMMNAIKDISFGTFLQDADFKGMPFGKAKQMFNTSSDLINKAEGALAQVPSPEYVDRVCAEIKKLLGQDVADWKTADENGSLGTLYNEIQLQP